MRKSVVITTLALPAESHIKYIFSLVYIGHYEQNDMYKFSYLSL